MRHTPSYRFSIISAFCSQYIHILLAFHSYLVREKARCKCYANLMKDTFVLDSRKSFRSVSAKADTYLCAITQLVGVLLADSIHKLSLFKSLRKLIA